MAKISEVAEKPSKISKKKSQQNLKADAPVKTKKTKQQEEVVAEPSSSKPKAEKKKKHVTIAEVVLVPEVADKKKRKAAAVEEKSEEVPAKSSKKRRNSAAAESAETVKEGVAKKSDSAKAVEAAPKSAKKSKAAPVVQEEPAVPQKASKKAKGKAQPKAPSPQPEESAQEDNDAEEEEEEGENEYFGFSSDDDDSSDEEMAEDIPGIDIGKLPTVAKDDETVKRKLEKAKRKPTEDRGAIYLGRLPHGFFEDQMRAYFTQFGTVTRLRLSRNKKTGKSKHYAFIEFDSSSVAAIVAETMDNYLLMGHILTCKLIPKDQVHPELWVGANRKWRAVPRDRVARLAHNKPRTEDETEKAERRLLKRQEQRKRKLEEAGIKYDFEAVAYKKKPKLTEA
ncbi:hypothetical protein C2E23DRAFT_787356 [Lenzites betulinus]|nr:hypothetical protein C2E23DRAFT_787356 [Lenzites betulinus]